MSNAFSSVRPVARALAISLLTLSMLLASATVSHAAGVNAQSVKTGDTGNGKIDFVTVAFNVPMRTSTTPQAAAAPGEPGFYVAGYTITGFTWPTASTLRINLAEGPALDGAATPLVTYETGGEADSALGIEADAFSKVATDGAGPVLMGARVHDQPPNAGLFNNASTATDKGDELTLTFSEPVTLAGATRLDRWTNLEKAIRFNNIAAEGNGCTRDGQGLNDFFNFPQPDVGNTSGPDAILEPSNASTPTTTIRVQYLTGTLRPNATFPGVPHGCWIGVEPGTVNTGNLLVGSDGNPAITQTAGPGVIQAKPTPVDAALKVAETRDGVGGPRDGVIDALELVFDQGIDLDTIRSASGDPLNVPAIRLGSASAIVDAASIRHRQNAASQDITNTVIVPFTLPAGVQWDTGARPRVSFAKPSNCSADTTANGIKAKIPSGGAWRACVGSFDLEAHDRAAPLALAASTTDQNGNGRLDRVTVAFSEVLAQGHAAGWSLNGQPATGFVLGVDGKTAQIPFAEGPEGDTGALASVSYAAQAASAQQTRDAWNNQVAAASLSAVDGAAPRIVSASVHDEDADGALDRVVLVYSENIIDPPAAGAGAFRVGGVAATGFAPGSGDEAGDDVLTLVVDVPGTAARGITVTGSAVADAQGNLAGDQVVDVAQVVDQAPAVATIAVSPSAPLGVGVSTVTVTYSEAMNVASAPAVALGGTTVSPATGEHTNGFHTDDASVWEGTVNVAEGDCATATGCAVSVTATGGADGAGIAPRAASLATEIDTIAPQAPTLGTFSTQQSGGAVPADAVNMYTRAIALGAGIVAGDAAGGYAELLDGGNAIPDTRSAAIGASATTASAGRSFADLAALRGVLSEGSHQLSVQVCDDAGNCSMSVGHLEVTVDTEAIDVSLVEPSTDAILGGGDVQAIVWDADETALDLDHVELHLSSNDGATFPTMIEGAATEADGSHDWTVPAIDVNRARVRASTVDALGNRASAVSGRFAIDSTAPVISLDAPSADPFVPAGGQSLVRWTATDATLDRAADPIAIDFSDDGGLTWEPINGGAYSTADDGSEAWRVPQVRSFDLLVRVTATDATGKTASQVSSPLASGVTGYVANSGGAVFPFGTADGRTDESYVRSGDWLKGLALAPSGVTGYTLAGNGKLFGFSIGGAAKPPRVNLRLGADNARGVVLLGKTKGYVLDKRGGIHAFGGAPKATPTQRWRRCDCARAIVLNAERTGGYVLSGYGNVFPFAIGKHDAPAKPIRGNLWKRKYAKDLVMNADGRGGYILVGTGRLVAFGGAPRLVSSDVKRGAGAQALVQVTDAGGYWLDHRGALHAYGEAIGDPTRTAALVKHPARGAALA